MDYSPQALHLLTKYIESTMHCARDYAKNNDFVKAGILHAQAAGAREGAWQMGVISQDDYFDLSSKVRCIVF